MKEKPVSEKKDTGSDRIYVLTLINDEVNTFDHVIKSLVDICGHDSVQAEQCAVITHFKGSCDIKNGRSSLLIAMQRKLGKRNLVSEIKPV